MRMSEEAKVNAYCIGALLLCLIAFGIVGKMDYEAERAMECSPLAYDSDKDVCVKPPEKKGTANA